LGCYVGCKLAKRPIGKRLLQPPEQIDREAGAG
jgi:hypothetical protein